MADRWIVSGYEFAEQTSFASAAREMARLAEKTGGKKKFRVYRIKTKLESSQNICALIDAARNLSGLWKTQKISGATRAERNAAIEDARAALVAAIEKMDADDAAYRERNTAPKTQTTKSE